MLIVAMDDGEAAAVDGDAGGDGELVGESGGVNSEFAAGWTRFEARDGSQVLDDAGEHAIQFTVDG